MFVCVKTSAEMPYLRLVVQTHFTQGGQPDEKKKRKLDQDQFRNLHRALALAVLESQNSLLIPVAEAAFGCHVLVNTSAHLPCVRLFPEKVSHRALALAVLKR